MAHVRGEAHGRSKLTAEKVVAMRERRRRTGEGITALARRFGVSHSTAHKAITGESWAHVSGALTPTSKRERNETIIARYVNGERQREIARDLGISQATVSSVVCGAWRAS